MLCGFPCTDSKLIRGQNVVIHGLGIVLGFHPEFSSDLVMVEHGVGVRHLQVRGEQVREDEVKA